MEGKPKINNKHTGGGKDTWEKHTGEAAGGNDVCRTDNHLGLFLNTKKTPTRLFPDFRDFFHVRNIRIKWFAKSLSPSTKR